MTAKPEEIFDKMAASMWEPVKKFHEYAALSAIEYAKGNKAADQAAFHKWTGMAQSAEDSRSIALQYGRALVSAAKEEALANIRKQGGIDHVDAKKLRVALAAVIVQVNEFPKLQASLEKILADIQPAPEQST